jgi:hypothetical protein
LQVAFGERGIQAIDLHCSNHAKPSPPLLRYHKRISEEFHGGVTRWLEENCGRMKKANY